MSLLVVPDPKPPSSRRIAAFETLLGPTRVWRDESRRRAASVDYAWMSPVLSKALPDVIADVVLAPRTVSELAHILAIAFEHDVSVTGRGKGTGNYGQAVPLAGGVVVDTNALAEIIDVGDNWIHAEVGATFVRLEAAARACGRELAVFPSTVNSSLGGFLCGGAGGPGSITHGFVWDGIAKAAEVLPCWDAPEPRWVEESDTLPFLHTYGTTGMISSAVVKLTPAHRWTAVFASFPTFHSAASCGLATLALEPRPRNVSVDDPDVVACFPVDTAMPARWWSVRVIAETATVDALRELVVDHGGRVEAVRSDATGLLVSLSYNHVTLRVKRLHPDWFHLQMGGSAVVQLHDQIRDAVPGSVLHMDAQSVGGVCGFGGLLLAPFRGVDDLYAAIDRLRALGVHVVDPHTWMLGAHWDVTALRSTAKCFDPSGLLNPGKLPAA